VIFRWLKNNGVMFHHLKITHTWFFPVLVVTFVISVAARVQGAPIISQTFPPEPTGALSSYYAGYPDEVRIADNFIFGGSSSKAVRSLRFIGGRGIADASARPENFRVLFLNDREGNVPFSSEGIPGSPVPGGDFVVNAFSRTPTGGRLLTTNTEPFEYEVNLPDAVVLNPRTLIDGRIATTGGDVATGPWFPSSGPSVGMYFELNEESVPEPFTLPLLAIGCIACLIVRRKSASQDRV
jgi:hypothetical protein